MQRNQRVFKNNYPNFKVSGVTKDNVAKCKYLGNIITADIKDKVTARETKQTRTFYLNRLNPVLFHEHLPLKIKKPLVQGTVVVIATFGYESWALSHSNV